MKFSNIFEVLRLSCFATKREIESSFLSWCGDIDETEAKIEKAIAGLSNPEINLRVIDPEIEATEEIDPRMRQRIVETKISELREYERLFKELGKQYEAIMDGDLDTRFQYITETMDLYDIAGIERNATDEEITKKISDRIKDCYFTNIEEDETGENTRKNEIEILERIKLILTVPEKRAQYDESLRKREEEKRRRDAENDGKKVNLTRAIEKTRQVQEVSDPDAVLIAFFGPEAARIPSSKNSEIEPEKVEPQTRKIEVDENGNEVISPIFQKPQRVSQYKKTVYEEISPILKKENREPIRTMSQQRPKSANIRSQAPKSPKQAEREEVIKKLEKERREREARNQRTIKGVKRVTAAAIALLIAGGMQYGKQAENDITFGKNSKPAVVENVPITPNFMPDGAELFEPTPTVAPTPEPVQYDSMLEAYQGLPEGSLYRKAFEQAVLDMTGVKDGSNVEAFIGIMDMNYNAGTDVVTVAEFNRRVGVGLIKAGLAEALYLEDGRVLDLDDIVIRQTGANSSTRFIVNNVEMFKTDWTRTGNGSIKPYANEPMTETMANDIDYVSKLFDATGGNKMDIEPNPDACMAFTPIVYERNIAICEDIANGINPYGIENGKVGVREQRPQTQRTISMEDVLDGDELGLE